MTDRQSQQGIEAQIAERASRDPGFRQELLHNPRQALQEELGIDIPADVEVKVVEETASTFYLVLPAAPVAAGQELSEQDLAHVAGGWSAASECMTCNTDCSCQRSNCCHPVGP